MIMVTDRIWNYGYSSMYKIVLMIVLWYGAGVSPVWCDVMYCQWYSVNPRPGLYPLIPHDVGVRWWHSGHEHINHFSCELTLPSWSRVDNYLLLTVYYFVTNHNDPAILSHTLAHKHVTDPNTQRPTTDKSVGNYFFYGKSDLKNYQIVYFDLIYIKWRNSDTWTSSSTFPSSLKSGNWI